MIEGMLSVTLAAPVSEKKEMLKSLRKLGLMHVSSLKKSCEASDVIDRDITQMMNIISAIKEIGSKQKNLEQKSLSDKEFKELNNNLKELLVEKGQDVEELRRLSMLRSELEPWGDIDLSDLNYLTSNGVKLYFYTLGKKEKESLKADENVSFISLKEVNSMNAIAVIGKPLDKAFPANEFIPGEVSLNQLINREKELNNRLSFINETFSNSACYVDAYKKQIKLSSQDSMFEKVDATCEDVEVITLLHGYIPQDDISSFKDFASKNGYAYLIDEIKDDENPPTKIKYKGLIRIIKPLYDILGTVPGYREYDISLYFLLYFSVFFAMIIGDAGYGLIFLLIAALIHIKSKKASDVVILVYVLGATTVIWGALTGTWFGSVNVINALPFLKVFIIPSICNFSEELYGIPSVFAQNTVMKFCFILGASQIGLACVINVVSKIRAKNLSFIADIGWLIDVLVIYMLVLFLVLNEKVNFPLIIGGVACGFVLVCLFGKQEPGLKFSKGLVKSLSDAFTVFLNTISCFGNVMSYIRLFAVGMASLAIADSFNEMAGGMLSGFALPAGILVLVIGHALNLVMGLLSVVVHGVRLNLLEFSNQLGMEWTGYNYDPFKETAIK